VVEERTFLDRALARATSGVEEIIRLLPPAEAELFEPELAILAELGPALRARVDAGVRATQAVAEAIPEGSTDLLADARARLLGTLACDERSVAALLADRDGERVLVAESLTPSVVASLPPRVGGIIAASKGAGPPGTGSSSHAAILARGRDIALAFLPPGAIDTIVDDAMLVVDTTVQPASVWPSPSAARIADARVRREAWTRARADEEAKVAVPFERLGIRILLNISSLHEHVPAGSDGIGLVRTELVFSGHVTAPGEAEQFGALRAIAARAGGMPVVVRLFDAGGEKVLPWLPAPTGSDARGVELLIMHPEILDAQIRAIERAAEREDLRILLALVRRAEDVERIRARTRRGLPVGAMVETPDAVDAIDSIAAAADFICIGTNDLSAEVNGQDRVESALSMDSRVTRMIERVVTGAHVRARKVTVCGELASDPHCVRILIGLGVDAISVATTRFARVKGSLGDLSLDECRAAAREALK
jgi:phosphoenolpyruvate-protein kinase (PTS system EI component)